MCVTISGGSASGGVRNRPSRLRKRPNGSWPNSADSGIEQTRPSVTGIIHQKNAGWMRYTSSAAIKPAAVCQACARRILGQSSPFRVAPLGAPGDLAADQHKRHRERGEEHQDRRHQRREQVLGDEAGHGARCAAEGLALLALNSTSSVASTLGKVSIASVTRKSSSDSLPPPMSR